MLQHSPPTGQWTDEMRKTFVHLKSALISTPALDLLDYTQPLHLYATEKEGLASGLLVQKHGYRPVVYYSSKVSINIIKYYQLIKDLLATILLTKRLTILKYEAHNTSSDSVSLETCMR